jgi:hypothetical protein
MILSAFPGVFEPGAIGSVQTGNAGAQEQIGLRFRFQVYGNGPARAH